MSTANLHLPAQLDPHRWRALALGIGALGLTLLDLSIVSVILPPLGAATGANPAQLLWVVSGYALAIGIVPILGGRLGDDYGRRRMLLLGIRGFVLTSALVGLAPDIRVVLAGRVLQGLFGGLINPQVSGVVQELFVGPERGRAFGLLGAAVGIFTAAGPLVGGGLVAVGGPDFGWRLCFLVNVPLGAVVLVMCRRWWPAPQPQSHRRLDLPGAAMLTVALFFALFPAVEFTTRRDPRLALLLIVTAAFATLFAWWEHGPGARRGYPLIDVTLFRIGSFTSGLGVGLLFFCAFNGLGLVLALYLQDGLGLSAGQTGCVVALYAIGTAGGSMAAGRLLPRCGPAVLPFALGVFALGTASAAVVSATLSGVLSPVGVVAALAAPLVLAGFGGGGVVSPNQVLALADLGALGGSTAGGMLQTAQRLGNAIGAAVLSAVYYTVVTSGHVHGSTEATRRAGQAYGLALLAAFCFAVGAAVLAIRQSQQTRQTRFAREAVAMDNQMLIADNS